ncbi:MAG TPA: glutaminyl-peptide cyclotransferase [Candidatus Aminicenantes bacterium]|nr:glutaminyl-peptide cyclotransferase [Candidatus Aminicenantes bacterium]
MHPLLRIPLILLALAVLCTQLTAKPADVIPQRGFKVILTLPHDPQAFTQGLLYHDDHLYESTGQYGRSELRKVEWSTGKVVQAYSLANNLFAEGIALRGEWIYQLTWMSRHCLVFDRKKLKPVRVLDMRFSSRGWGLTWDGHSLIASDGSFRLYFLDPEDLSLRRTLTVKAAGRPLSFLNELEAVDGRILANIWQDTRIAEISPLSGKVTAWIECAALVPAHLRNDPELVLNGIATGPKKNQLFVTGKQWPVLYLIELKPGS